MHRSNFWDKMGNVDWQKDKIYIVLRVLQFGTQSDFDELRKTYPIQEILEIAQKHYYNLDELTRNFLNLKYNLHLPLTKSLNATASGYSLRFHKNIFAG